MRGNYIKKWHAQARNVIKRTFGILKNQFAIMKTATQYYYKDQVSIVITCHVMHNLILMHGGCDSYDDDVINENDNEDNVETFRRDHCYELWPYLCVNEVLLLLVFL